MRTKIWKGILASLGMLVLILDAKTALQGGSDGLRVCMMTVIPSLLPFFVLSILLTSSLSGLQLRVLRPIGRLCKMPSGSEPLLLLGLLGGYPAGAQAVSQAYHAGQLTKSDAQRLLGFCSNAGPSFLFGIAATAFAEPWLSWLLWGIHILSALITGMLLPGSPSSSPCLQTKSTVSFPQAVERAVRIMAKVCAWIVLFRVLLAFLDRWFLWFFPTEIRVILTGILELANGCLQLSRMSSTGLRFVVCSGILSFGGISVIMQTLSVTGSLGHGMYLPGKLIQCSVSSFLAYLLQVFVCGEGRIVFSPIFIISYILIFGILLLFLQKRKNNSRIPAKLIV